MPTVWQEAAITVAEAAAQKESVIFLVMQNVPAMINGREYKRAHRKADSVFIFK